MSFNDRRPADLEAQPTSWRRQDDPEYQDLLQETGDGFKEIGEGVKKAQSWHDMGPSQKYTSGKLGQEFRASLNEFQVLQKQALSKQKASANAARVALDSEAVGAEGAAGMGSQPQQQLLQQDQIRLADQSEVDFQEALIIERESEIRNIEQSVSELNELFRDVATMISDQGNQLDTIDVNVMNTRDDMRNADQQLRTASRHQKSARGRACCLLVILAIVLAVVILAIVL
jgi:syntaxin 7